jgi:alpha-ketoglutarate-dependent taurine dioxygenase
VTGEKKSSAPPPDESHQWAWHVTDKKWHKGISFAGWGVSAKAHVGRLCAYATAPATRTAAQTTLVDAALAYRSLPANFHGVASTLAGLNGRWSTSTSYADKVTQIANALVATQV